ncbi:gamma carbonic anhydrase family protein [Ornithinimicrobium humiphilum]|uniref:Carbonic anhydrase/acetyltransferase-like protein (Isoleucine patch superfamily) n=1 Tax=Ornithinimicrobium humiphilum TaxID=125288 RepID=A0A543KLG6_9MICO|nr:gamma carbonic anhydrase family protein [Ornithinimicrobium humiphilum]TQM95935.1 carbonic anhydrase/acetyltransferase-like protein (isoleucine patch superfamily) [Ornithinimicrobium humiphilum]
MTTTGLVLALGDRRPEIHPDAWLAPHSVVSGSVTIGAGSSVWYGASLRGDNEQITVGERANFQDNVVVHADPGHPAVVGDDVSVGHAAVLHGCTVGSGTIVGMGAVVMNGAVIGEGCLVAGGAVVLEGMEIPPGSLVAGVPAKVRRELTEEERAGLMRGISHYPELATRHRAALAEQD